MALDKNRFIITLVTLIIGILLTIITVCVNVCVLKATRSSPERCQLWDSEPANHEPKPFKNHSSADFRSVANFYGHLSLTQMETNPDSIKRRYLPFSLERVESFRTPDLNYRLLAGAECGSIELQLYRNKANQMQTVNYAIVFVDQKAFCYFRPSQMEVRGLKRHYRCAKEDSYECRLFSEQIYSSARFVFRRLEFEVDGAADWIRQNGTFSTAADDCM